MFGVVIVVVVLVIILNDMIFGFVFFVWVGFGVVFGLVILLSFYWCKFINWGVLVGMFVGVVIVFIWKVFDIGFYELFFVFVFVLIVVVVVSLVMYWYDDEI